MARVLANH